MNTKIYKEVLFLAKELMTCANKKDQAGFDDYYQELQQLCEDNEGTDKDHPVQWETLGDFTDDLERAIAVYDKALQKAAAINSKDYLSSIGFSAAQLKIELGDNAGAIEYLEQAKIHSNKIIDKELKAEIHDLLTALKDA
ncbi:tetratricopeptide repeat protein [Marinomonas sp. M1K-6]|uniref:Tetratricopeptide repeat protein n=1 Tax=Marinomonas profundi TaxID=2726122 RepID=A0A847QX30_9GAMM|nr:tetratricopeptide repeat protein [Marinomonas profundi]NLQ16869.1 tetratricopeptide repeat protein [Marinomonas profundi]UDV02601.1 tetratricopeptide repeat protein [Marinomonas profundi]